jgi:hypothetical protein
MKVLLAHLPNLDITGGYWQEPIDPPLRWESVQNLTEARALCLSYIQLNGLGSGNWVGGEVREGKQKIARISYNGRIRQA